MGSPVMRDRWSFSRLSLFTLVLVAAALCGCASAGGGRAPVDEPLEVIDGNAARVYGLDKPVQAN